MTGKADTSERRRQFRALHQGGCFILPNPWDAGSARYLQSAGFKALASTSSGHAWSQGKADGTEDLEQVLAHLREMSEATALPLNADLGGNRGQSRLSQPSKRKPCSDPSSKTSESMRVSAALYMFKDGQWTVYRKPASLY